MYLGATSLRVMNCLSEFHLQTTASCGCSVLQEYPGKKTPQPAEAAKTQGDGWQVEDPR